MADNPLATVAAHVTSTRFEDLPPAAVERTRTFLLDTIGVGIAGSSGAGIDALKAVVAGWGAGDEAAVWVSGERMTAWQAAIVNAYQIHCLEFDCVHEGAVLHPMATVLSAVLAWTGREAARGRSVSGRELIAAVVLGVDVACLLGIAATGPIRFFRPATGGGFGAVAAIGRLAGLTAAQLLGAFGSQYSQTSGTLQPHVEGSMLLGLQVGFNASAALRAVDLALAGIEGPHDVLTGPYGYLRLMEDGKFDLGRVMPQLGTAWRVLELSHKPYPSGRLTHGVVDGLGRLMREHAVAPASVAAVTCRVPPLVMRLVGRPDIPHPEPNYAKLCLRFVAGLFLVRGHVDVPDFRDRATLDDPDIHRAAALIEVIGDGNPDENALDPQTIAIRLVSGAEHAITLDHVYGHPDHPLTAAENEAKFRRCLRFAARPFPPGRADALVEAVGGLERLDDVAVLTRLLVA